MTIRLAIINGPNLNLLGKREESIYGSQSFESFLQHLEQKFPQFSFTYYQSNVEGELVNALQNLAAESDGIIINAAAYSHTSIAIPDAIAAVDTPAIGVHISNIYQREDVRHIDLLAKSCKACLFGFGLMGYEMAIRYFENLMDDKQV